MTSDPTIAPVPASGGTQQPGRDRSMLKFFAVAMQVRAAEERLDRALPEQVR